MRPDTKADIVRISFYVPPDLKAAMDELAQKRWREEGSYVSLGRVFSEAARLLLRREGIVISSAPDEVPLPKPVKSLVRRKVAVRA
jgi:hypothetical protein